jgi:hypothetical protein
VQTILTDNGSEFTDRFGGAYWSTRREPTGRHAFDRVCARHGIGHRLTRPFRPQTNGMVERFNRRLSEAIGAKQSVAKNEGKNKFHTHAERNAFLHAFVERYNRTRLKCLDYRAPAELLLNPPEPNTCAGMTLRGGTRLTHPIRHPRGGGDPGHFEIRARSSGGTRAQSSLFEVRERQERG